MKQITLQAPLSGYLMPLERVPDPVFAQKMVGDGIALDPASPSLLAPCDGHVVQLHPAHHALTLATTDGLELLMHIGLDTVNLKGAGFEPVVKTGDQVKLGDPLIHFDADYVATHAKSLLTMIVVTNSERVAGIKGHSGSVTAGQESILEVTLNGEQADHIKKDFEPVVSNAILIPNHDGLHARPAAVLTNIARKYQADIYLQKGSEQANAKSVVALMNLNVRHNDKVKLIARGTDAHEAIRTLGPMVEQGLGEAGATPVSAPASVSVAEINAPAPRPRSDDPNLLLGVTASPGLAVGNIFQIRHATIKVTETATDPQQEAEHLRQAIEVAKIELEALQARLHVEADPAKAAIFAAHQELLEDPDLMDMTRSTIAKGKSAAFAWQTAVNTQADSLARLKNELIAARANDLRDVGRRVLQHLTGTEVEAIEAPANAILVAEDLTPSDTANLDRSKVLGFCTTLGGATSHVAILARSLDIPAVAGIDPRTLDLANGTPVILDGRQGTLRLNPSPEEVTRIRDLQQKHAAKHQTDLAHAAEPAITSDGHQLEIVANIGGLADAEQITHLGGEGVGLLRSEFLFLERTSAPSEDEQAETYTAIARALGPNRPLVIRTLDVGGDKPLPYLPIPHEENPFLGERGIRVGLDRPEILRTQLRAILRASAAGKVMVMFPMIATLAEWRAAKAMLEEEREKLGVPAIPVGIMVEVPAAAVLAEQFAREADFFSIGTNDLTQYTLAMDRGHAKLAPKVDGLNPAVLHLIAQTVKGAHQHDKWVGVCGGIASDPQAVPFLIGLGVDELSLSLPAIPGVKAQIRALSLSECQSLAKKALTLDTAAEVRALAPNA
ncbi:MAG: phosphoenolpyruvate--protein phosphotransferase [Anaerolineae bacterium]|nr:phosphoenolpyruvate--protein phosphotransferase [Anaerolineae bacterium]